jgi:hypothetical protein
MIRPVPADTDAGSITPAQLEKQARALASIGLFPSPVPGYKEGVLPAFALPAVSGWTDYIYEVDLTAPPPGPYMTRFSVTLANSNYSCGIRDRNSEGEVRSISYASGLGNPQIFGRILRHFLPLRAFPSRAGISSHRTPSTITVGTMTIDPEVRCQNL